jgi:hypothetical protein
MEAQAAALPAASDEAPAEAPAEQPAAPAAPKEKAKRSGSGLPPHVQLAANKKSYYARLRWLPLGAAAKRYDTIPGLFDTPEKAAAAHAAAQERLQAVGPEAVWADGLPTEKKREKRDTAYWAAEKASREEKAAEKAALKAAREAAEAARPKKRRKEKTSPTCETTALPRDASQVCDATMRAFLQPLHASAANAPACAQAPPTQQSPLPPIPVALAPES